MKKIIIKNEPIVFQNKDFQTIIIKVMFYFKVTDENLAKIALLPSMLNNMNALYPSEEDMILAKKNKFILDSVCFDSIIGNNGLLIFQLVIPDMNTLKKDYYEEQLDFFKNFIYNPLIIDGGFSEFELEREKKNLKLSLSNSKKNLKSYQYLTIKKLMDDQGILSRTIHDHIDLIDKVTPQSLYQYFLDIVKNNQPLIYVFGNSTSTTLLKKIKSSLYLKKYDSKTINIDKYYFFTPREDVLEYEEDSNFKDSCLTYIYKVKDMKKEDIVYLIIIQELLSSLSSRLLGKKLRTEKELIYSAFASEYRYYGALEITAFIKKDNVLEVKKTLLEVMEELHDSKKIQPLLDNVIEKRRVNLLKKLDNKFLLFSELVIKDLEMDYTLEEYYEIIKKIKAKDIAEFVDRLVLDTVYFLKEGENDSVR